MLENTGHFVAIGGGQAAFQAIQSLRSGGFAGPITLIGEESDLPYQRPPLSKDYLKGRLARERLFFRPGSWYGEQEVALRLGIRAEGIDPGAGRITLSDGSALAYDAALIATGSRPRPLPVPGADLSGVLEIRSLADIDRLQAVARRGARAVVVGAGYIGLEAAAALRDIGLSVTVLELADRVLARVTGPTMSEFFARLHASHGVEIRTGVRVAAIAGEGGRARAVRLADGEEIAADIVIAGIGIVPNTEVAEEAGLACADGIEVDEDGRTSAPGIFAAGDCTTRPLALVGGGRMRLESVHNAVEQGRLVAAALLGQPRPAVDVPWFWSDQYDVKLQIAGLGTGHDATVMRPGARPGSFAVFYLAQDRLQAVDAVNAPAEYMTGKKLIAAQNPLDRVALADPAVPIRSFLPQSGNGSS